MKKLGDLIKDRIANTLWPMLADIEAAIKAELRPPWQEGATESEVSFSQTISTGSCERQRVVFGHDHSLALAATPGTLTSLPVAPVAGARSRAPVDWRGLAPRGSVDGEGGVLRVEVTEPWPAARALDAIELNAREIF